MVTSVLLGLILLSATEGNMQAPFDSGRVKQSFKRACFVTTVSHLVALLDRLPDLLTAAQV